ncbi:DUF4968 domain-containing protein [Hungatella hathewayi]|uniref:DUF4968 domain-containing protein n=1 Tax=Hungatella hathewayi TaxID=154046 RepID=UPI0006828474|nr:DUF4968 domain-containing protein [Hungatella hathewayi]
MWRRRWRKLERYLRKKQKTNQEIAEERSAQGRFELEFRDKIGPKKIIVPGGQKEAGPGKARSAGNQLGAGNRPSTGNRLGNAEFGTMPSTGSLRPPGHSNINSAIRWVTRQKDYLELTSACGVLRITPISGNTARISFAKESINHLPAIPGELSVTPGLAWKYREDKTIVEVQFGNMLLLVDKKTGGVSFYTAKGTLLLSEASPMPRLISTSPKNQTWSYFNWTKKETLKARGLYDKQLIDLKSTAKYISCGETSQRPACLISSNGYQILVSAGQRVMCCTIPVYGTYLSAEEETQIDYFFTMKSGESGT